MIRTKLKTSLLNRKKKLNRERFFHPRIVVNFRPVALSLYTSLTQGFIYRIQAERVDLRTAQLIKLTGNYDSKLWKLCCTIFKTIKNLKQIKNMLYINMENNHKKERDSSKKVSVHVLSMSQKLKCSDVTIKQLGKSKKEIKSWHNNI